MRHPIDWIHFKEVMEKWALSKLGLYQIIDSDLLTVYWDYNYNPNYFSEFLNPLPVPSLAFADYDPEKLFFKRTDVEHFEKTYRKFLPSAALLYRENDKEITKQEISTADIQNEITEQDHDVFIEKKVFPCNPGTRWDQIEMALLPEENYFMVKTPLGHDYYDHIKLGLFDDRTKSKKPNSLWAFLKQLAKKDGFFPLDGVQNFELVSSNAKRLDKHLKQLFGIKESIFKGRCDRIGGYETKFKIKQISDDKTIHIGKSLINEELEDPKYDILKESSYYPEHSTFK